MKNGKWVAVDLQDGTNSNIRTEKIDNYQDSNLKLIRTTERVTAPTIITGVARQLELKQNDVLVTEKYYHLNGLILYEIQTLNSKPVGEKVYKYAS